MATRLKFLMATGLGYQVAEVGDIVPVEDEALVRVLVAGRRAEPAEGEAEVKAPTAITTEATKTKGKK